MKEKFKNLMIQGGFSVIIAVVAMVLYLTVMYFSNNYFKSQTQPAKLTVSKEGVISIEGFETEESEVIYVLWETDAGNIKPTEKNELFMEQWSDENNKWYYANTTLDESIVWDCADADGTEYKTASVRAIIYSYDSSVNKDKYYMGNYVNQMDITVTVEDGVVKKADETRYFCNPERKDKDSDWNQIYVINETDEYITYRYRTGKKIKDEMLFLAWEAEKPVLAATKYEMGLYPECLSDSEKSEKEIIVAADTLTLKKSDIEGLEISAYLIDEDTYDNYLECDRIEGNKIQKAIK